MKTNPKKHKQDRRVRNPLPSRKIQILEKVLPCKTCMIKPREKGSSHCKGCADEYHAKHSTRD